MAASVFNVYMKRKWGIVALSAGVLLSGCSGPAPSLVQPLPVVVQPAGEPWGVDVALVIDEAVHLEMANAGLRPVRVLWDECVYIDGAQEAHRLLTASAWQHRDFGAQVPAQLAPGSRLRETLYPLGAHRERLASVVPPPPSLGERTWVGVKRWLFFQWQAQPRRPDPQTVGVFLVLEDHNGRKTLTAPYAIGHATVASAISRRPGG